jgi:hypothetical protein
MRDDSRNFELDADRSDGEQRSDDRVYGAARGDEQTEGERVPRRDPRKSDREDPFGADDLDESLAARRQEEEGEVF